MPRGWIDNYKELLVARNVVALLTSSPTNVSGLRFDDWHRFVSEDWICEALAVIQDCPQHQLRERLDIEEVAKLLRHAIVSKSSRLVRKHTALWQAFGANPATLERLAKAIDDFHEACTREAVESSLYRIIDLRDGIPNIPFSSALTEFSNTLLGLWKESNTGLIRACIPRQMIGSGTEHTEFPIVNIGRQTEEANLLNYDFSVAVLFSLNEANSYNSAGEPNPIHQQWKAFLRELPRFDRKLRGGEAATGSQVELLRLPAWFEDYAAGLNVNEVEFASAGLAVAIQSIICGRRIPFGLGFSGEWRNSHLTPVRELNRKMVAAKRAGCVLFFACVHPDEWNALSPPRGLRLAALPSDRELSDLLPMINFVCGATGFTDFYAKCRSGAITNPLVGLNTGILSAEVMDPPYVGFVGRREDLRSLVRSLESGPASISAIVAPARFGKTSLLMQTVKNVSPPPAWFKIDRSIPRSRYCNALISCLRQQLLDRYVLFSSSLEVLAGADELPCIIGPVSVVVDGIDEAASEKEAEKIQEALIASYPNARILLGSQPGVLKNIEEVFPISFPRFDDEWMATEHSINDATELIATYEGRFKKKKLLREASLVAQEGYARRAAERARGGLGHLSEYLESICRQHSILPDDPDLFPEFSDERACVNDSLVDMLSTYAPDERPRIQLFTAALAFMRGRTWAISDVVGLVDLNDDHRFGEWAPTGLLSRGIARILESTPDHVRFYSPHTAQAIRIHYRSEFPSIARKMLARLQSCTEGELCGALVNNIAGLITEFGAPQLGDELISSRWAGMRFQSLVEPSDRVRLLIDELYQLPTLEKTATVKACCDWIIQWESAIDQTPEVRSSWKRYDPSGLLSQDVVRTNEVPILFEPVILPTGISLDAGDNTDVDGVHLRIDGAFNDGTVSVCAAYVFDRTYPETTGHRHVAADGSLKCINRQFWSYVAADNMECRIHREKCILESRFAPTDNWSKYELAPLLGLVSASEHRRSLPDTDDDDVDWDAMNAPDVSEADAEPQPFLEIQDAVIASPNNVVCTAMVKANKGSKRCLVLVEFSGGDSPLVTQIELGGKHGSLVFGMRDLLVFEEMRDEGNYPVGEYIVEAATGNRFPTKGTLPSLRLVAVSEDHILILVGATEKGCKGAYLYASGVMPPRYLADTTHFSEYTFVTDISDDCVTLVSLQSSGISWAIQSSVLQLSCAIVVNQQADRVPVAIKGWVVASCVTRDLIVIAFTSGRIEVRSTSYPFCIRAIAFVSVSFEGELEDWVEITDLKVLQTISGLWLWVATNQVNRFDLSDLVEKNT